jgi:pimeloyl-ACP methyl ester carboxylesterase
MAWAQERFYEGASGDYGAVERLQSAAPAMSTDEFAKVMRALTRFHRAEVDLSSIAVPTLVLYGENETGLVKRHVPRLTTEIPDATVRVVPGAGHASNVDAPEFFSTALREFLARIHGDGTIGAGRTEDAGVGTGR